MDQNIRLGKIAGISIGINWSILVIFMLVSWELSDLVLPNYDPHNATATYWVVGVLTALLFFASLLAHEVSHAVVAKRNDVGVRRITLWLFGGVSELEGEALTPGADFRIAVVGPVTSLILAACFWAMGSLLQHLGAGDVVVAASGWLAWMNVLLGVFNLMPAAPLDGGRVLRAALWQRSGDRLGAATSAARAGQVFGYVLVTLGVLEFLAVGITGLWFVFLGWFLLTAARAEESGAAMRTSLADVQVRDIMTRDPVTFSPTSSVSGLVDGLLEQYHFASYPLVSADGHPVGLTTMNRIRSLDPRLRDSTRLLDIASVIDEIPVGAPHDSIAGLLERMYASPDGRAFVIDGTGRLVGIVSPSDVARHVQLSLLRSQSHSAHQKRAA
ncbi:MAG: site-2 protease family protein [Acidimicrobiales bacterium]